MDVPGDLLTDALTVAVGGQPVGVVGMLAPAALDLLDGRAPVAYAELNLSALLGLAGTRPARLRALQPPARPPSATSPSCSRAPKPWATCSRRSSAAGAPLVRDVRVFDLYEGAGVPEGHRSVAFKLTLATDTGTLRDAEVEAAITAVRKAVETQHSAALRG